MKFYPGLEFEEAGIQYRVLEGNRCVGDMVIEFRVVGLGWHRPRISHSLILMDFKAQVEENNYGPNGKIKRASGKGKLYSTIRDAVNDGWEDAAEKIRREREALARNGQGQLFPQRQGESVLRGLPQGTD